MDELGEKLDELLHDPQQLGRIAQLASSLMGDGGETQPPSEPQPEPGFDAGQLRRMLSAVRGSGRDSASRHLLEAMKPYLAEKRRRKSGKRKSRSVNDESAERKIHPIGL